MAGRRRRPACTHCCAPDRDVALVDRSIASLREQGLIVAWRDETYADRAATRRAAAGPDRTRRGALLGHADLRRALPTAIWPTPAAGRRHLWIARRSLHKATDPGKLDNLVGGGVPHGQTPFETLVREGFEEAGLARRPDAPRHAGPRDRTGLRHSEGFMHEQLHSFDLRLPADLAPSNQDGEVAELRLRAGG